MTSPGAHNDIRKLLLERLPEEIGDDREFERWFEPLKLRISVAVQRVHYEVKAALDAARARILAREGVARDVWFVTGTDGKSLMKSMKSVRSKLGRELREREDGGHLIPGRLSIDQVERLLFSFGDLGRFRIICDLSDDVREAKGVLLSDPENWLLGRYPVRSNKDFVYDLELRKPAQGHRARQLTVEVEEDGQPVLVEIQLMTLLQNAWDRRNHPLYEWHREGGKLPAPLRINDVALAETLHLVDEQAARNWREFLEIRRASR